MKLAFRTWLEDERLTRQDVQPRYNEPVVDAYVRASTNNAVTNTLVNKFLRMGRGVINEIYQAPISGNLLSIQDERLGAATTVFDSENRPRFKFYDAGKEAGNIWLRFPPVIFTQEDRILLKSILIHELQHADDWASGNLQQAEASYEFDLQKYLGNVSEARGLYVQLKYLLRRVGDVDQIVKLLSADTAFQMRSELIPVAKDFLNHYKSLGEAWGTLLAPFVAAAGMGGGDPATAEIPQNYANPTRPAAVYNIQREDARVAASVVLRVVQAFTFGQYVSQPGKKN